MQLVNALHYLVDHFCAMFRLAFGIDGSVGGTARIARNLKHRGIHLLHCGGGFRNTLRLLIRATAGLFHLGGKLFGSGGKPVGNGIGVLRHLGNGITLLLDGGLLLFDFRQVEHKCYCTNNIAVQIADQRGINAQIFVLAVCKGHCCFNAMCVYSLAQTFMADGTLVDIPVEKFSRSHALIVVGLAAFAHKLDHGIIHIGDAHICICNQGGEGDALQYAVSKTQAVFEHCGRFFKIACKFS